MRFPACPGFVAACILCLGLTGVTRGQERQPARTDQQKDLDRQIYALLKNVINKGADLYTIDGDRAGCYRLYEGSLMTLRPLLAHHPDLQKAIDASFTKAEQQQPVGNRAFALREALDKVRTELKPAQAQTGSAAGKTNTPSSTLWQRLGGEQNVTRVIDDFVDRAAKDPKVNFDRNGKYKFDAAKLADLKKKLVAMVSEASGGPLKYTGKSMKEVHKGMDITDAEFDALAAHLKKALEDHGARPADVAASKLSATRERTSWKRNKDWLRYTAVYIAGVPMRWLGSEGLQITPFQPFALYRFRTVADEQIHELLGISGFLQDLPVPRLEEPLHDRMIEPGKKRLEEAVDVEDADWLGMQSELCPGENFEQLIGGAKRSRQGGEAIRQVGHQGLALVHRADNV